MDVVEVLEKAKERLRGHWCQGALYRDSESNEVIPEVPGCRVCAYGAIGSVCRSTPPSVSRGRLLDRLDEAAYMISDGEFSGAPSYNDAEGRTEEEVLALFDKAIELAKAEAAGG